MHRHIRARRRSALTNYRKRMALLKGGLPRLVLRRSNRTITMQIISYRPDGDIVLASASSRELAKEGWPARANVPTAYLTGLVLARKARELKERRVVLDVGLYKPVKSSVVFAGAKGAADGGIEVLNGIEIDAKRLSGEHISNYAKSIKDDARQFSSYRKDKIDVSSIHTLFESVKRKIAA